MNHIDGLLCGSSLHYYKKNDFERNKVTTKTLKTLECSNKSSDKHMGEEIQIMQILIKEYAAEKSRFEGILALFKLDAVPCDSTVKIISKMTCDIGNNEIVLLPIKHDSLNITQTQSLQFLQSIEIFQQSLNQIYKNEDPENVSKVKETEFLLKKTNEYTTHIRHLEKKIDNSGFNIVVKHSELQDEARKLSKSKSSLAQLRLKLDVYSDLTPDINLARIQVRNLKEELQNLEAEITDNISNINSS